MDILQKVLEDNKSKYIDIEKCCKEGLMIFMKDIQELKSRNQELVTKAQEKVLECIKKGHTYNLTEDVLAEIYIAITKASVEVKDKQFRYLLEKSSSLIPLKEKLTQLFIQKLLTEEGKVDIYVK